MKWYLGCMNWSSATLQGIEYGSTYNIIIVPVQVGIMKHLFVGAEYPVDELFEIVRFRLPVIRVLSVGGTAKHQFAFHGNNKYTCFYSIINPKPILSIVTVSNR